MPADKRFPPLDQETVRRIARERQTLDGPLLPILHAIQTHFGYVDECALTVVAKELNLSRAEVHGVVSFYHDFRNAPAPHRCIRVCRAEACQSLGAETLYQTLKSALTQVPGTSVESVYCLGNCALAPAAMIDGQLLGRLDVDRALAALEP
ncbi:MAG: NAD(P)H-dependent oxidoreductase subunit E [Gammaproteobacteria bacterium]|nr:NAD(P)H-dependent oxidoreductase subunit E [Gammaproteobacteria bacterium]